MVKVVPAIDETPSTSSLFSKEGLTTASAVVQGAGSTEGVRERDEQMQKILAATSGHHSCTGPWDPCELDVPAWRDCLIITFVILSMPYLLALYCAVALYLLAARLPLRMLSLVCVDGVTPQPHAPLSTLRGSSGHPSAQSSMPSPSLSLSGTPHPHVPGAVLVLS